MNAKLKQRWNQVLPRLRSNEFLHNKGLGNEIAFYIFDYPPEFELDIRDELKNMIEQFGKVKPDLKLVHINLFELLMEYLRKRKLLKPALKLQQDKGNEMMKKALKGPLHETKIAQYFQETIKPNDYDLILISGIGNSFPMIRSNTLLNNLHPVIQETPLVLFYPGSYDGQHLKLFGKLQENNYYRAFQLVS